MANWQNPKHDYVGSDDVTPNIFNRLGENEQYLKEEQDKVKDTQKGVLSSLEQVAKDQTKQDGRLSGLEGRATTLEQNKIETDDVQNANINITQASTRTNLGTKESVKSVFGKIKKWFSDLRALAFKDKIVESDISGTVSTSKISGLHKVATSGSYNDLNNKPTITKEAIGLGNVANERQYSPQNKPTKTDVGLGNVDNIRQFSASNPPDIMNGNDTRNDNQLPEWYIKNKGIASIVTEFKYCSTVAVNTIFSCTYCQVTTFNSWGDSSGGYPVQCAMASGDANKIAVRSGISATEWSAWSLFYNGKNPPPYPVTKVAGRTGEVALTKSDVGLSNLENVKYLPLTGGSVSGALDVTDVIKAYRYSKSQGLPAITLDKPGGNCAAIGPDGTNMKIKFSTSTNIDGTDWVNDQAMLWDFIGQLMENGSRVYSGANPPAKVKVGSTTYTLRTGTSGAAGYITFVL